MSHPMRATAVLLTLLLAGCATTPSGPFDSLAGVWKERLEMPSGKTISNTVTMIDETRGTYILQSGLAGRIEGFPIDDQRIWKSYWILESGSNACSTKKSGSRFWGETVVEVNEAYNKYKGYWNSCGEGAKYAVTGRR